MELKTQDLLIEAVHALAAVDDGAVTRDNVGFNGTDTGLGQWLATQPAHSWTDEMRAAAHEMLAKYRRQLTTRGIEYDTIPEPSAVRDARNRAQELRVARNRAKREGDRHAAEITARQLFTEGPSFIVQTAAYNADIVGAVKQIPGRRWDGRRNIIPRSAAAAAPLDALAREYEFTVTPEARAALDKLLADPVSREKPKVGQVVYDSAKDVFSITFSASDELFRTLLNGVKGIEGRRWDGDAKANVIPAIPEAALGLVRYVQEHDFALGDGVLDRLARLADEGRDIEKKRAELHELSGALDAEHEVEGLGGTLRPFQKAGVAYAVKTRRGFNADEMGTGKTIQALAALKDADAFPAVVVMPAAVKAKWKLEIEGPTKAAPHGWLPGTRVITLAGRKPNPLLFRGDLSNTIILVNWDILPAWAGLKGKKKKGKPAIPDAPEVLSKLPIKGLVFDESHYGKESDAQRTRAALLLSETVRRRHGDDALVLNLSGSPILNRPIELAPQLEIVGMLDSVFGGFFKFARRYAGAYKDDQGHWDFSGSSNLSELHEKLRQHGYVRRLKKDVLPELPPKQFSRVPATLTNAAEYKRVEADVVAWLRENAVRDEDFLESLEGLSAEERKNATWKHRTETEHRARKAEELVRLNALRRTAAQGLIKPAIEWVKDFLASSDEKLVVFAYHKDVQHALYEAFREQAVHIGAGSHGKGLDTKFQTDPRIRVAVASLSAAREGIDLFAASNVLFIERNWSPKTEEQAEDRIHRIGQDADSATYWYLHPTNPDDNIYDWLDELLEKKRAVASEATDGEVQERVMGESVQGEVVKRLLAKGAR